MSKIIIFPSSYINSWSWVSRVSPSSSGQRWDPHWTRNTFIIRPLKDTVIELGKMPTGCLTSPLGQRSKSVHGENPHTQTWGKLFRDLSPARKHLFSSMLHLKDITLEPGKAGGWPLSGALWGKALKLKAVWKKFLSCLTSEGSTLTPPLLWNLRGLL